MKIGGLFPRFVLAKITSITNVTNVTKVIRVTNVTFVILVIRVKNAAHRNLKGCPLIAIFCNPLKKQQNPAACFNRCAARPPLFFKKESIYACLKKINNSPFNYNTSFFLLRGIGGYIYIYIGGKGVFFFFSFF
jgi:hypothetical protein